MPKKPPPTGRPKRPAIRLGDINTKQLVRQLRELHRLGEDPALERFPDDDELFLALLHAQRWSSELVQPSGHPVNLAAEAAILRVTLWQYLREQADTGQLKAIEDGRAAGVEWEHFAPGLCVLSKQGAYQKARRLRAEQLRQPGERRTPETAREHELRIAAEARAERSQILAQRKRFPLAQEVARRLLASRDGLDLDEWSEYWLDEIEETIDNREDPAKQARFVGWLESFMRAVHARSQATGTTCALTEDAGQALRQGWDFLHRQEG